MTDERRKHIQDAADLFVDSDECWLDEVKSAHIESFMKGCEWADANPDVDLIHRQHEVIIEAEKCVLDLTAEILNLKAKLKTAIEALKEAHDIIDGEFCGEQHHDNCKRILEALEKLK